MDRTVEILEKVKSEAITPFAIFQAVCLDIAEKTKANRVSIWHLEKDHSCIRCDCFYETDKGVFSAGQVLFADTIRIISNLFLRRNSLSRRTPATIRRRQS